MKDIKCDKPKCKKLIGYKKQNGRKEYSEREKLEKEFEKILSDKKAHYELREKLVIKEVKRDLLKSLLEVACEHCKDKMKYYAKRSIY